MSQVIPGGQQVGKNEIVYQVQGNIIKESFKSLSSKREDMNESNSPMGQRNALKETL